MRNELNEFVYNTPKYFKVLGCDFEGSNLWFEFDFMFFPLKFTLLAKNQGPK